MGVNHYVVSTTRHHKVYNRRSSKAPECLERSGGRGLENRIAPDKIKHGIDNLMCRGNVPRCKSLLATGPNGGSEQARRLDFERDWLDFVPVYGRSGGDRDRWVHYRLRAAHGVERAHRAEHILVGLVVARAEDEFRVGVSVQKPLDNFAFVDCHRTDFEVLLAHEY